MRTQNLEQHRVDAIESEGQQLRAVRLGSSGAYPPIARALLLDEDGGSPGPDLRQLLAAVRYRRGAIATILGIGCALFVLAAALIPPSFTAIAQIDVAVSPGGEPIPVDSRANQMIVDTHLVTLKSRGFLRLALAKSLELFPNDPSGGDQARLDANSLSHDELEWLLEEFEKRISANQSLSSSVISIGYTSQNPDHSAGVVNLLVSLYRGMLREKEEAAQKANLERLDERIAELKRKSDAGRARLLEQLNPSVSGSQPTGSNKLPDLEAEVHTNAQLLADLLRRQAEARRSLEMFGSGISVVSAASSPVSRSSLHPALFIAPGMVLLFIGSCFWAVGREQWDPRLRSAADVARVLALPCIGLLPRQKWSSLLRRRRHFAAEKLFAPHTEAIRSVAAALDVAAPSRASQLVLLTCSGPDEGKTALAIDIAEYATSLGKRVLLVDLDARTPALLSELNVKASQGVTDIVLHDADPQALVQTCPGVSFYFLPICPTEIDPLALVTSEKLNAALAGFRSSYDLVLIDGPQIAGRADALLVPELVDKVLFVAKWGTRLQPAKEAASALRGCRQARESEDGAVACIVTRVPTRERSRLQGAVPVAPANCCRAPW